MSAESVKVIVRVRPLNEREYGLKCNSVVDIEISRGQCSIKNPHDLKASPKSFFFDGAYDKDSTTEQLYNDIVYPLVENVTEGYNGTVFAYGQTGCGKSYTMQGVTSPETQRGVIPRAFDHIFETISIIENTKYLVYASYLEIYNEEIRDLLAKDVKAKLDLKEHPETGVYVQGLTKHKVSNVKDCQVVMERGWKNRSTGATQMNVDSSRSHSIFTIYLEMIDTDSEGENHIRAGKLNLVDLAGSERQSKTGSTGDRLKEATKINLSLSALGNVISALVDSKSKHIPYRDSKLTRLLQDSLGGNTKTLMIACLSPADNNYDESLSTLRYANRAKNIQNKPKINEDPKDALLRQYQEEINRLKMMLAGQMPEGISNTSQNGPTLTSQERHLLIEEEREKLREEYEVKLKDKEQLYSAEAADKEKMRRDMEKLKSYYDKKLAALDIKDIARTDEVIGSFISEETPVKSNGRPDSIQEYETLLGIPSAPPCSASSDNSDNSSVIIVDENGYQTMANQRLMSAKYMQRNEKPLHGKNDLLDKLKYLESGMIGGEQANNNVVKEKYNKKKKYAEERRRRLMELNANMEDDGIMLDVYENIQDDLRAKMKVIRNYKEENMNLKQEVLDLQDEFQREKCEYLDTIRRQERDNLLLASILDKVQPLIRRNCNYSNLDKIKQQARFNEETGKWILPDIRKDDSCLPDKDDINTRDLEDEKLYHKLSHKPDPTQEYFMNNRRSGYLINNSNINNPVKNRPVSPYNTNHTNNGYHEQQNWRAGGHRLESIAAPRKSKKKRDKYSNDGNDF